MTYRVGDVVHGKYQVLAFINEGATSSIFKVKDVLTGESLAIKLPLRPKHAERIEREARILAQLQGSPHVPFFRGYELDKNAGTLLVMEFFETGSLSDLLKDRGRLSEPECWELCQHIALALACALGVEPKILHKDLKPANILLRTGTTPQWVLSDWGEADDFDAMFKTRLQAGTPAYYAPEIAHGSRYPSTDVYSLGMLVYEAFSATGWPQSFREIHSGAWAEHPAFSPRLREVLGYILTPDPLQRPDAIQLLEIMERCQDQRRNQTIIAIHEPPGPLFVQGVYVGGQGYFETLGEACAAARPGSWIMIMPGVYSEEVVLDKSLILMGLGPREGIIWDGVDGPAVKVTAAGVALFNLTLCGGGEHAAIHVVGGAIRVDGCEIIPNGGCGLRMEGARVKGEVLRSHFRGAGRLVVVLAGTLDVRSCTFVGYADDRGWNRTIKLGVGVSDAEVRIYDSKFQRCDTAIKGVADGRIYLQECVVEDAHDAIYLEKAECICFDFLYERKSKSSGGMVLINARACLDGVEMTGHYGVFAYVLGGSSFLLYNAEITDYGHGIIARGYDESTEIVVAMDIENVLMVSQEAEIRDNYTNSSICPFDVRCARVTMRHVRTMIRDVGSGGGSNKLLGWLSHRHPIQFFHCKIDVSDSQFILSKNFNRPVYMCNRHSMMIIHDSIGVFDSCVIQSLLYAVYTHDSKVVYNKVSFIRPPWNREELRSSREEFALVLLGTREYTDSAFHFVRFNGCIFDAKNKEEALLVNPRTNAMVVYGPSSVLSEKWPYKYTNLKIQLFADVYLTSNLKSSLADKMLTYLAEDELTVDDLFWSGVGNGKSAEQVSRFHGNRLIIPGENYRGGNFSQDFFEYLSPWQYNEILMPEMKNLSISALSGLTGWEIDRLPSMPQLKNMVIDTLDWRDFGANPQERINALLVHLTRENPASKNTGNSVVGVPSIDWFILGGLFSSATDAMLGQLALLRGYLIILQGSPEHGKVWDPKSDIPAINRYVACTTWKGNGVGYRFEKSMYDSNVVHEVIRALMPWQGRSIGFSIPATDSALFQGTEDILAHQRDEIRIFSEFHKCDNLLLKSKARVIEMLGVGNDSIDTRDWFNRRLPSEHSFRDNNKIVTWSEERITITRK